MVFGKAAPRTVLLFAAALVAAVAASSATALPRTPAVSLSPLESGVLADINAFRAQHGLAQLRVNAKLTAAARAHSAQMAQDGYFAHESADGSPFWKRVQRFYARTRFWSVGENLLFASPTIDPNGALKLWLASPEHRRNLMNPRWREIGVSAVHATSAPGTYQGMDVTIVTTDFGVRH